MRRYQDKNLKRFDEAYKRMLEAEAGNPAEVIKQGIDAPFVNAKQSNLGGTPFYGIYVSLDPKEEWANQIYQNSRHFTFGWDGEKLDLLTKHHKIPLKLRKAKAADAETVVAKINKYLQAIEQSMTESFEENSNPWKDKEQEKVDSGQLPPRVQTYHGEFEWDGEHWVDVENPSSKWRNMQKTDDGFQPYNNPDPVDSNWMSDVGGYLYDDDAEYNEADDELQRQAFARRGTVSHEIDPEVGAYDGFDEKPGLEGPFKSKTGHIYYYDSRAGQYYDPKRDMYIDNTELTDYGIF